MFENLQFWEPIKYQGDINEGITIAQPKRAK